MASLIPATIYYFIFIPIINAQKYILQQENLTPSNGNKLCLFNYDENLASLHSATDWSDARTTAGTDDVFIGLTDQTTDGTWVWYDNTIFDYGNPPASSNPPWRVGQPDNWDGDGNNPEGEDCVHMNEYGNDGEWNDVFCTAARYALCNYPQITPLFNDPSHYTRIPTPNNIIGIIDILDNIHIEFDIKFASWPSSTVWGSILQISDGVTGWERFPAIYIHGAGYFHTSTALITPYSTNPVQADGNVLNLGQIYHFSYIQTQDTLKIYVDSDAMYDGAVGSHAILKNRNIYLSNTFNTDAAQLYNAEINNLYIASNNAHSPNGFNYNCDGNNRWENIVGDWNINPAGCIVSMTNSGNVRSTVWMGGYDTSSMDWDTYKIEVRFQIDAGEHAGIFVRAQSISNQNNQGHQYFFGISEACCYIDEVFVGKFFNNNWYYATGSNVGITYGQIYTMRIEASSNSFDVYWNNEFKFTFTDDYNLGGTGPYYTGSVGLTGYKAAATYHSVRITFPTDNYLYTVPPSPSPTTATPTTTAPSTSIPTTSTPTTNNPTTLNPTTTQPTTSTPTTSIPSTSIPSTISPTTTIPTTSTPTTATPTNNAPTTVTPTTTNPTTSNPTSNAPTLIPTAQPTYIPTFIPTKLPTHDPTIDPTKDPTFIPTIIPTNNPTFIPTFIPTYNPINIPTNTPTKTPTYEPTSNPTTVPTFYPTANPSNIPTNIPTFIPSQNPTYIPSNNPTLQPSTTPTNIPTNIPSKPPSKYPTANPSIHPSSTPSTHPTQGTGNEGGVGNGAQTTQNTNSNGAGNLTSLQDTFGLSTIYVLVIVIATLVCLTMCLLFCLYKKRKREQIIAKNNAIISVELERIGSVSSIPETPMATTNMTTDTMRQTNTNGVHDTNEDAVLPNAEPDVYSDDNALSMWLTSIGLMEYFDVFIEQGFGEQMSTLSALTDHDLEKMGITKLAHRKRILLQIANNNNMINNQYNDMNNNSIPPLPPNYLMNMNGMNMNNMNEQNNMEGPLTNTGEYNAIQPGSDMINSNTMGNMGNMNQNENAEEYEYYYENEQDEKQNETDDESENGSADILYEKGDKMSPGGPVQTKGNM